MIANIHIQVEDFDVSDEVEAMTADQPTTGAVASTSGATRERSATPFHGASP